VSALQWPLQQSASTAQGSWAPTQAQAPFVQLRLAQTVPHWPQLAGSVVRSTHAPPHGHSPAPHGWQVPSAGSQCPRQQSASTRQLLPSSLQAQKPLLQLRLAHTTPHWPQLPGSVVRSTSTPPHG
jgi:hypothetical protein